MKNFKLMQLIPSMHSGGVEQGTIDLSNYLTKKNYSNHIVSSGGKLLSNLVKPQTTHLKLSLDSKNFFIYPFMARKLQYLINNYESNIIHFRSRAPAWLLPFLTKKNFYTVSTFHNVYGNQNFIKSFYNKQLGNVNSIVAISNYVKKEIVKQYSLDEKKITVINRGCDVNYFDEKKIDNKEVNSFFNKFKIPVNKKIVLFPGRLTGWKGQIDFLDVIENFVNSKNLFFIFVGDGKNLSYKEKLIKQINKKDLNSSCILLNHMNLNDLRILYFISKIVISAPLKPEGFGRIISESIAMKRVVLAYNFGGAKDQLSYLNNVYQVEQLNKKNLIEKINHVIKLKDDQYENLSNESRNQICKFFSKEKMLNEYLNFYLNL